MKKGLLRNIIISTALFAVIFSFAHITNAKPTDPNDVTSIIPTLSPEIPKAYDDVTINIVSYSADLPRSIIRWYVDEKMVEEGPALTEFHVTAGNYGTTKNVRVQVVTTDGVIREKKIVITPSDVSLIWQADTYVPPFYKGKRLYSDSSDLLFMAIPRGKYAASDLIYKWKQDADVILNSGGYGKNTVRVPGSFVTRDKAITVEVSSIDGLYIAKQTVSMSSVRPQIAMYEDNSVTGIQFENALGNSSTIKTNEFKIAAFPYFFSTKNRFLEDLDYIWSIGNNDLSQTEARSTITLRKDASVPSAIVSVEARHKSKILQDTLTSATLNFAKDNN